MRIVFAYPYTAADGTEYSPDIPVEVEVGLAASLMHNGLARQAAPFTPTPEVNPEAPSAEASKPKALKTQKES